MKKFKYQKYFDMIDESKQIAPQLFNLIDGCGVSDIKFMMIDFITAAEKYFKQRFKKEIMSLMDAYKNDPIGTFNRRFEKNELIFYCVKPLQLLDYRTYTAAHYTESRRQHIDHKNFKKPRKAVEGSD